MQGRQDEVPGQGGLHGDASGLDVANLADEDHVGVLAQDGPESGGEGQTRLFVGLNLIDLWEDVFHRIFDGHHVSARVADFRERRVQRRRLAAAGRPGAQDHAERSTDEME